MTSRQGMIAAACGVALVLLLDMTLMYRRVVSLDVLDAIIRGQWSAAAVLGFRWRPARAEPGPRIVLALSLWTIGMGLAWVSHQTDLRRGGFNPSALVPLVAAGVQFLSIGVLKRLFFPTAVTSALRRRWSIADGIVAAYGVALVATYVRSVGGLPAMIPSDAPSTATRVAFTYGAVTYGAAVYVVAAESIVSAVVATAVAAVMFRWCDAECRCDAESRCDAGKPNVPHPVTCAVLLYVVWLSFRSYPRSWGGIIQTQIIAAITVAAVIALAQVWTPITPNQKIP